MKCRIVILSAILTASTGMVLGRSNFGTALADFKPAAVTIDIAENRNSEAQAWHASGGINDRGSLQTIWLVEVVGSSSTPRIVHIDSKFTNAEGTGSFTIRRNLISTPTPELSRGLETGTWDITSAAGVYLGLRGQGIVAGANQAGVVSDSLYGVAWWAQ
jgi:hypothetical protein